MQATMNHRDAAKWRETLDRMERQGDVRSIEVGTWWVRRLVFLGLAVERGGMIAPAEAGR